MVLSLYAMLSKASLKLLRSFGLIIEACHLMSLVLAISALDIYVSFLIIIILMMSVDDILDVFVNWY